MAAWLVEYAFDKIHLCMQIQYKWRWQGYLGYIYVPNLATVSQFLAFILSIKSLCNYYGTLDSVFLWKLVTDWHVLFNSIGSCQAFLAIDLSQHWQWYGCSISAIIYNPSVSTLDAKCVDKNLNVVGCSHTNQPGLSSSHEHFQIVTPLGLLDPYRLS